MKKTGTHTSDRVNVGTTVKHHTSNGSVKSSYAGPGAVLHSGQPKNLSGKGFSAGQSGKNC